MSVLINGLTAGFIILACLIIIIRSVHSLQCNKIWRWQYYLRMFAALAVIIAFGVAFFDGLSGGDGTVLPEFGRPAIILFSTAFALALMFEDRQRGCK
jgi:hypothetical protein